MLIFAFVRILYFHHFFFHLLLCLLIFASFFIRLSFSISVRLLCKSTNKDKERKQSYVILKVFNPNSNFHFRSSYTLFRRFSGALFFLSLSHFLSALFSHFCFRLISATRRNDFQPDICFYFLRVLQYNKSDFMQQNARSRAFSLALAGVCVMPCLLSEIYFSCSPALLPSLCAHSICSFTFYFEFFRSFFARCVPLCFSISFFAF